MLLRLPLVVEHQLDDAILTNDICLPALQKPQQILLHPILLPDLSKES